MADYGSVDEVAAICRWMLNNQSTFNSTTQPTSTQVETFLDRASGVLNLALAQHGFSVPITNATVKPAMDEWVVQRAVAVAELSYPMSGDVVNDHAMWLRDNMQKHAEQWVAANVNGLKNLGLDVPKDDSRGLLFTAQDAYEDRSDPDNTSLAQPKFRRGQFDA